MLNRRVCDSGNPGFYQSLLDQLYDGVYFLDIERRISYWNAAAERITGYRREEILGRCCGDNILMHLDQQGTLLCQSGCPAAKAMREDRLLEKELSFLHKEGYRVPVLVRVSPVKDAQGQIIGAAEIFSKNTVVVQQRQIITELKRMALVDSLTEIGNRLYMEQGIITKLNELRRFGWPLGMLFMDIDHFKAINDKHGHEMGDRVLKVVARSLQNGVRSIDLLGRWGGEEFVALFVNTNLDGLRVVANKLHRLVEQSSFEHEQSRIQVTLSIGGTLARPEDIVETLVKRADQLMYEAKRKGRNRIMLES